MAERAEPRSIESGNRARYVTEESVRVAAEVQRLPGRSTAYDAEAYYQARNLRFVLRICGDTVAAGMGLNSEQLSALEATDVIFWSRQELRSYAEQLGFGQWLVTNKDGRRQYVIAQSEHQAAREACWQRIDCASVGRAPESLEWRIETLSRLWTVRQAAEFLDVSPRHLHELVANGSLPHVDLGGEPTKGHPKIGLAPELVVQHGTGRGQRRSPRPLGPSPMGPHDEMVRGARATAIRLARRYWRRSLGKIEFDDLRQEADLALLAAAEEYEPDRGMKFASYAYGRIRWHLIRYCDDHVSTVRVPPHKQGVARASLVSSLHVPSCEGASTSLLDILRAPDESGGGPEGLSDVVAAAIDALPRREREVLLEHDAEGTTLECIAQKAGLTRERIRQVRERALERVRNAIGRADARARYEGERERVRAAGVRARHEAEVDARAEVETPHAPSPRRTHAPTWEAVCLEIARLRAARTRDPVSQSPGSIGTGVGAAKASSPPQMRVLATPIKSEPETPKRAGLAVRSLAVRIPWAEVAERRATGEADWRIARSVAASLRENRYLVEKALRQPQAAENCGELGAAALERGAP
jgi:RNA polymerase sigma factor (sigma-70 family)